LTFSADLGILQSKEIAFPEDRSGCLVEAT